MDILGIIPARKGSKRIPGKNTKPLLGMPLVEYILKAASASKCLTRTVVSSNDEDVKNIVKAYSRVEFVERPEHLATDISPAIEYVQHVLDTLDKSEQINVVVILQPTTPLMTAEDIDGTIKLLLNNSEADSAVSVAKIEQMQHPYKLKTMKGNMLLPFLKDEGQIKAAHELPDIYSRNGAVYASRMETIKKGIIIGKVCLGYVMPSERSVDINNPIDFEFAEFLAKKNLLQ